MLWQGHWAEGLGAVAGRAECFSWAGGRVAGRQEPRACGHPGVFALQPARGESHQPKVPTLPPTGPPPLPVGIKTCASLNAFLSCFLQKRAAVLCPGSAGPQCPGLRAWWTVVWALEEHCGPWCTS